MTEAVQPQTSPEAQGLLGRLVYALGILLVSAAAAVVLLCVLILVVWIWLRIGISIKFFGNA